MKQREDLQRKRVETDVCQRLVSRPIPPWSLVGFLVDIFGASSGAPVGGCIGLLVREVPSVEIAGTSAQAE